MLNFYDLTFKVEPLRQDSINFKSDFGCKSLSYL